MLDLVVVDLACPNRPQTLGRKLYDMVIVDTYSQRFFVVLLAKKSVMTPLRRQLNTTLINS